MQIYKTTDLKQFKTLKSNRTIYQDHVALLSRKIEKRNLLECSPILVNEKMEVIDGQHRLEVARKKDLPIYYIKKEGLGIDDVILLNTAAKRWNVEDYTNHYVELGLEPYIKVKEISTKYGLTTAVCAAILYSDPDVERAPHFPQRRYRQGEYSITNPEEAERFIKNLIEFRRFTAGRLVWKDREFVVALWRVYYVYNIAHTTLMDKIKNYPQPIFFRDTTREYLFQLEQVLNIRKKMPTTLA